MRVSPNIFNVCFSLSHESRGYVECLFCGLFVAYLPLLLHTHTRKLYTHTHTHTYNYIHTHTHHILVPPSLLPYCAIYDQVVHPKSDSQRRRLIESVKKIFLFKSLDTVSGLDTFS